MTGPRAAANHVRREGRIDCPKAEVLSRRDLRSHKLVKEMPRDLACDAEGLSHSRTSAAKSGMEDGI
jgi:hypothetical protein